MTWNTIQQLIRILMYAAGSAYFGTEIADGDMFQALIGAMVTLGSFIWWMIHEWNRNKA